MVASTSGTTGSGVEVLAGADHLVAADSGAGSAFYQNLDTTKVGAAGHSQGVSGALNATTLSDGLIVSTMTFNLPDPIWVSQEHVTDFSQIVDPVFFVTGTNDWLISSASGQTGYYDQVPGAAAKASLRGAGHNTIQGTGGGYLGYTVAWFRCTLQGDATACGAFAGGSPELLTNASWSNQATKNLYGAGSRLGCSCPPRSGRTATVVPVSRGSTRARCPAST